MLSCHLLSVFTYHGFSVAVFSDLKWISLFRRSADIHIILGPLAMSHKRWTKRYSQFAIAHVKSFFDKEKDTTSESGYSVSWCRLFVEGLKPSPNAQNSTSSTVVPSLNSMSYRHSSFGYTGGQGFSYFMIVNR